MIAHFEARLSDLSIHRIGNKSQEEYLILSDQPLPLNDDLLNQLLIKYFLAGFEKVNEVYHFKHSGDDLQLNEVYHYATAIFDRKSTFHENSKQIGKHLYENSAHPNIKSGELYIAYFNSVQIDGELVDAIGIFKSETKETYLKVHPENDGFSVNYEQDAININKLDKGCIIFNTEKEKGYKVAVIDHTNRNHDTVYWKDDFLRLKIRNDAYNQTNNVLGVYKSFISQKIDDEFELSKADKIDLLNKSMKYFKEKETFDIDEFSNDVIGDPKGIESFRNFKSNYENEFESPIADSFDINQAAVKKQSRVFKSVLKLDKNFHIYIHGDKQLIEKGFDDDKAMSYYKVWFKEEN